MRSIETYDDDELETIEDTEVENIIRWECAEEGVKFLNPPEPKNFEEIVIPKDDEVFEIDGLYFRDEALAEELAQWLRKNKKHIYETDYDGDYEYQYVVPLGAKGWGDKNFIVERKQFYKREVLREKDTILKQRKIEKERFEEENEQYKKSHKDFQRISEYVWGRVLAARTRARARERFRSTLEEYKQIAKGDLETARRFFEKAYPDCEFTFEELNAGLTKAEGAQ